jgi:hypothetical protein
MSVFICTVKDCPNKNVSYDFGDESPESAQCGGCKTILLPKN